MKRVTRRRFIKKSIIIGAAITACPTVFIRKAPAAWARKTIVHPHVNNLRVVGIHDKRMTKDHKPVSSWATQDELVNTEVVWENMDKLVCSLAETRNPREAFRAIFLKPPRKSWSDTVVAIKTNNIAQQHTRSAVMAKICHTLTHEMGVNPVNIHVYDACHGSFMKRSTPFAGLPEGCRIEGKWGGSNKLTPVPAPWRKRKK